MNKEYFWNPIESFKKLFFNLIIKLITEGELNIFINENIFNNK